MPYAVIMYFLACAAVGFLGRDRRVGFWGFFIMSLFVSPIISVLFLFFSTPIEREIGDL